MNALITTYVGFYGQVQLPLSSEILESVILPFSSPYTLEAQTPLVVQWVDPVSHAMPLQIEEGTSTVLIAGMLYADVPLEQLMHRLCRTLLAGSIAALPAGDYCACLVNKEQVIFYQTATSNDTIFYRTDGDWLCWSTNPHDLAEVLDEVALQCCCAGDDPLVYQDVIALEACRIVCIEKERIEIVEAPPEEPLHLPQTLSLRDAALMTRAALLEATRPLRACSRVGVLLSGGIDSSALAATLVEHGIDVVAYHFAFPGSAADESAYAAAVCQALHIPFIPVSVNPGNAEYLSESWRFPHPYSHAAYAWMVEVADRIAQDGVRFLITGRGGDPAFSPADSYSLWAILRSPLRQREKRAMIAGAFSTTWQLSDLLKSLLPSYSLISHRSLSISRSDHKSEEPAVPFLRYQIQREVVQAVFSPHDLVLEQGVWRPRGIHVAHPYYSPAITRLARALPTPYLLLPYRGMKVVKPTLRLAFADRLPPLVVRHRWGSWLDEPSQRYCLEQAPQLAQLIGAPESEVVKHGMVERKALHTLLLDNRAIRRHYMPLLATAMVELFLRQWEATRGERRKVIGHHLFREGCYLP